MSRLETAWSMFRSRWVVRRGLVERGDGGGPDRVVAGAVHRPPRGHLDLQLQQAHARAAARAMPAKMSMLQCGRDGLGRAHGQRSEVRGQSRAGTRFIKVCVNSSTMEISPAAP